MGSIGIGFGVGLGLIVAIGAQNIWVLSQSMAGANRLVIAAVCILCDALLIVVGISSIALVQHWLPPLVPVLTWAGVALLLYLAFGAARRAWLGQGRLQAEQVKPDPWPKTMVTAFAITLLNPHVYLDTVVLIGSVGNQQSSPFWFGVGAVLASVVWFSSLTGFAPKLNVLLNSPLRWRCFDALIAVVMTAIALRLALS
ncbi:LysE family transporter [Rheinheimera sp.]|uniref:LysE/ArgO family amino acid transporter n=1 Tax=Rheinheimera sp. TaxID=1869214 RepID=UPI00307F597D